MPIVRQLFFLAALLASLIGWRPVPAAEEFLEPTKAFVVGARAADERTVEVQFDIADGYYLYNTPELQVKNLLDRLPNSTVAEQYNQYRTGVGHENVTSVMDMRRIEIGLRFKF